MKHVKIVEESHSFHRQETQTSDQTRLRHWSRGNPPTLCSTSLVHLVNHRRHFLERRGLHDLWVRSVDMPWYWLRTTTMTGTMCLRCGVDGLAESQRAGRLQGVLELHGYLTSGLLLRQDAEARSLSIWISCSIKPLPDCAHF